MLANLDLCSDKITRIQKTVWVVEYGSYLDCLIDFRRDIYLGNLACK